MISCRHFTCHQCEDDSTKELSTFKHAVQQTQLGRITTHSHDKWAMLPIEDYDEYQDLKQQLEEIRVALKGYKDSDLASLAKTLRVRNDYLENKMTGEDPVDGHCWDDE